MGSLAPLRNIRHHQLGLLRSCAEDVWCRSIVSSTSGNMPNVLNAILSNQRMCEDRSSLVFLPTASLASTIVSPISSEVHLHLDSLDFFPLPSAQPARTQPSSDLWLLIAPARAGNQFVTSKLSNSLPRIILVFASLYTSTNLCSPFSADHLSTPLTPWNCVVFVIVNKTTAPQPNMSVCSAPLILCHNNFRDLVTAG